MGPPRCSEARETIRKRQGHRIVQEKDVNLRKKGKNVPRALLGRRSGSIKTAKRQTAANCAPVLLVVLPRYYLIQFQVAVFSLRLQHYRNRKYVPNRGALERRAHTSSARPGEWLRKGRRAAPEVRCSFSYHLEIESGSSIGRYLSNRLAK